MKNPALARILKMARMIILAASGLPIGLVAPQGSGAEKEGFTQDEVLAPAQSHKHALEIAAAYGLTLKQYANGIARLAAPDPGATVTRSMQKSTKEGLPKLSLNKIYHPYETPGISKNTKTYKSESDTAVSDHREAVEKRRPIATRTNSSDSEEADEPGQWHRAEMDVDRAWNLSTGKGVTVAVIDTGIDIDHPAFAGRISAKSYNSFSDKIGLEDVRDQFGHGTHVSGIIAANLDKAADVCGVAPNVEILTINAINPDTFLFDEFSLLSGINYAVNNGADIINMSLGRHYYSGADDFERMTIANAVDKGVTVICAAGNDSFDHAGYPAAYPECIAVSATMQGYRFDSSYSNSGPEIDFAAPGSDIYSVNVGGGYVLNSGTSMASPNAAGVAAIVKALHKSYTPQQVRDALSQTAQRAGTLADRNDFYGNGIVSAYAAALGSGALLSIAYDDGLGGPFFVAKAAPGSRLIKPELPQRDDFAFGGWYIRGTDAKFDFGKPVTGNMTLYAKWITPEKGMYFTEFPDGIFRSEVLRVLNERDGRLRNDGDFIKDDLALLAYTESLYLVGLSLVDMTGIEYFTGLKELRCWYNELTALDVSKNTELIFLDCSFNGLTVLDVTKNTKLQELWCEFNQLPGLDVTKNTELQFLVCYNNYMNTPDDVKDWQKLNLLLGESLLYYYQKVIRITQQPAALTTETQGLVSASLRVVATVTEPKLALRYQWHSSETHSNRNGEPIPTATSSVFTVPNNLERGKYYYYCVVSMSSDEGIWEEASNVAVVKVVAPGEAGSRLFADVRENDWFFDAINFVAERGLMIGIGSHKFSPQSVLTTAMLVTIIHRMHSTPQSKSEEWYSDAVSWAKQNDIAYGCHDEAFDWNAPVSRELTMYIMHSYAKLKGMDVSASADLSNFTDRDEVSDWALVAVKWNIAVGIIQGRTATTIAPKGGSTRAETATILKRFIE